MELVEKKKVINKVNMAIRYLECKAVDRNSLIGYLKRCVEKIERMPTFDSEELKMFHTKGRWEWVYDYDIESYGYECSFCGWGHDEADISMNYCPNCGAKMENAE